MNGRNQPRERTPRCGSIRIWLLKNDGTRAPGTAAKPAVVHQRSPAISPVGRNAAGIIVIHSVTR